MDKNDFDIDFDFDQEFEEDPTVFADDGMDDDFDLSQFDDEPLPGEEVQEDFSQEDFQDFDLEEDDDFSQFLQEDAGMDASELDDDIIFPKHRREGPEENQDYPQEYEENYAEEGAYDGYVPQQEYAGEEPYREEYDPQAAYPEEYDPNYTGEENYDQQPKKRALPKLPSLPKLPKRKPKEECKPTFFSKFLDWYMEPIHRRNNPETETVDENGNRRRRKRPTKAQIIKEAYLPPLFAGIALLLIVSFISGAVTNAFKAKKIKDEQELQASIAASKEADQLATVYRQLLTQADELATQYDYDGAIAVLDSFTTDSTEVQQELTAKKSAYMNAKSQLVEWKDYSTIPNLSFHVLIQDPIRAFADQEYGGMYNRNFVTTEEFSKILNQLYSNNYVLVDFDSFVASSEDLTGTMNFSYNTLLLPEGKKPVMITETMVNYFAYMVDGNSDGIADAAGAGFANKLVLDGNGDIKASYVDGTGASSVGNYDLVPILEDFIAQHPDFSYKGARATLAVTGSEGVFGYRVDSSYVSTLGQETYDKEVADAKALVQALRDKGYTIACFTYANKDYKSISVNEIRNDIQSFTAQAVPVLGNVDTIVYARAVDTGDYSGNKFQVLYDAGYRYFVGYGNEMKTDIQISYVHQTRLMVTGNAMAWHSSDFNSYFDCNVVLDIANRGSVPN